jgi:hypothetical protein
MKTLNTAILGIPIPKRMQKLPISPKGYPVPWFVAWIDGVPDFRVIGPDKLVQAVNYKRCWLCGEPLGVHKTFVLGPMCTVNRTSAEPPCHLDCADYAVRACPFLTQPKMRRNEVGLPEDHQLPGGVMIKRNPGVTALWITKRYSAWRDPSGGALFTVGDPEQVFWFAEGRKAKREEVDNSIKTGLPLLMDVAEEEGPEAIEELYRCMTRARDLLPAA